jgi:hypothetical protein
MSSLAQYHGLTIVYCDLCSLLGLVPTLRPTQPTMTMPFSAAAAAAAAALDATAAPDHGVYAYLTEVGFLMKTTARQAPAILSLILAKLVPDEPTIIFNDVDNKRINQSKLPTEKATFDDIFSSTSSAGHLTCCFEIKSDRRSFHPIKMGVWDILQQHGVYFKKSTAPVKKISLSTLGFWANVHPSFASPHVFHAEICESIQLPYSSNPALLKQLNLAPEYTDPDIYLERRKLLAHSSMPPMAPPLPLIPKHSNVRRLG